MAFKFGGTRVTKRIQKAIPLLQRSRNPNFEAELAYRVDGVQVLPLSDLIEMIKKGLRA